MFNRSKQRAKFWRKKNRNYVVSQNLTTLLLLLYFTSPDLQAVECLLTRPGPVLTNDKNANERAEANEKQEIEKDERYCNITQSKQTTTFMKVSEPT